MQVHYLSSIEDMQAFFRSGATRCAADRADGLRRLDQAIELQMDSLHQALHADLRKSEPEAFLSETGYVLRDLRYARANLRRWMRPRRRRMPPALQPARARVVPEPKGVVLIIGPWNYPFQLLLSPLAAALAAGNCAVLKPSECAPHTAAAIHRLIADTFDPRHVQVVEGGRETAEELLRQPFDHIFFTGGSAVGRAVMTAAADRLTPVTLELGGKSPAIVLSGCNPAVTARRIARGKFINAGQTCVAPDHVWVERSVYEPFLDALQQALHQFYGDPPRQSPDYGRIINRRHFDRLTALCPECNCNTDDLFIAPTVCPDTPPDHPLMQDEIFGPILPVLPFDRDEQVIHWCAARPSPLALYLFGGRRLRRQRFIQAVPSGGVCVNDTVSQIIPPGLPFGGRGASGIGRYHGQAGFDELSHWRSILERSPRLDLPAAYPPITTPLKILKRFYRVFAG